MFTFLFKRQRLLLPVVFALIGLSTGYAQKANEKDPAPAIKFGQINPDQFVNATTDSTAETVVLYDYEEVTFDDNSNDLWLVSNYHIRLQIRLRAKYIRLSGAMQHCGCCC